MMQSVLDEYTDELGLSVREVEESRRRHGDNTLTQQKRKTFLHSLAGNFSDPMIKVLLTALGINLVFLFHNADWFDSVGIAAAVLIAVLVSTISEYGSESAFEKLQQESANISCRVRRGGVLKLVPIGEIVCGDVILLSAGDKVPVDGMMIDGEIDVDQSALNGESKECRKFVGGASGKNDLLSPENLYRGTVVTGGEGVMRATAVGDNTFYGSMAAQIQSEPRMSPLKLQLSGFAKTVSRFAYAGAGFAAMAYLFHVITATGDVLGTLQNPQLMGKYLLHAATLAVSVIVMAVPEGLPMMITVVLSSNMKKMLKDNVLVRKLSGIETAGSLNILFTDKTGTLTKGKLQVSDVIMGDNQVLKAEETPLRRLLTNSLRLNTGSQMNGDEIIGGNATDRALMSFASGFRFVAGEYNKVSMVPFDSKLKYMATNVSGRQNITFVKGAPEKILPECREYYLENGTTAPLRGLDSLYKRIDALGEESTRVIAVATSSAPIGAGSKLQNLKLVALIGIQDGLRPDAHSAVEKVTTAGIQTVMVTGDALSTAVAIGKACGILRFPDDIILTSTQLQGMSDDAIAEALPRLRVVARALPSDKIRLVKIAQSLNLVVGMTGDGVNDAPALKSADVGFAMGSGSEVAKEAGDIVVQNNNFMSIAKAIAYGRTIFKNIRKFIVYQVTINICAVMVTILAPFLGVESPITVIQILWLNIVMDTLAGLAFSGEAVRASYMKERPKRRGEPIMSKYMYWQIFTGAIYAGALSMWFLKSPRLARAFEGGETLYAMTAFFAFFMFLAVFVSFCARTNVSNLLSHISRNKRFVLVMGAVGVIQIFIIYFGGRTFRTVGLHWHDLLFVIGLAATVIPVDMLKKKVYGIVGLRE